MTLNMKLLKVMKIKYEITEGIDVMFEWLKGMRLNKNLRKELRLNMG